ncbi:MAG: tRNA (guanosine(37)-N1)-methyltransferase TrmD [Firmicutes bacterium]|nr:tRNA (guanosine(37)-N1)-methyltransferase TrmD [Bacillota bacterium]
MTIKILTLFPQMFAPLFESITGRAIDSGALNIEITDIRKYSADTKHFKCDDAPFGGGAGMILSPQPLYDAINAADPNHACHRVYLSPHGRIFNAGIAREFAALSKPLLLLCGRYEGIDRRIIDLCIDEELSIGDYILTGGELAAMAVADAVSRFVPGVLGNAQSAADESFSNGLLEYPQYTRPAEFMGLSVPQVLLSGHHGNVEKWRKEQAEKITRQKRPDLLK